MANDLLHLLSKLYQYSIAINFIGPPKDDGKSCIIMFTNNLGSDIQLVPSQTKITAEELPYIFFLISGIVRMDCLLTFASDRDKLFLLK